ncbi:hypothetical protein C0036_11950, partial [Streptomyces sp. DJ]
PAAVAAARVRRERDSDPHRAGLRRSVLAEVAVAAAVLAVTTLLTGTQPGRAEAESTASAADASTALADFPVTTTVVHDLCGPTGSGTALVGLDPGRAGGNRLGVSLKDLNGRPMDVEELKISFTLPSKDVGPLTADVRRVGLGYWTADRVQLPYAGEWEMDVTLRTSEIDQVTVMRKLRIQ